MVSSLSLHLDHPRFAVVRTDELRDVGCGMYPCYYVRREDEVRAATSVAALIAELGSVEVNDQFEVQAYVEELGEAGDVTRRTPIERALVSLPDPLVDAVPHGLEDLLRRTPLLADTSVNLWYPDWDTVDARIRRLRPFETVTPTDRRLRFEPTYSLDDPERLIAATADHLTRFVHRIERAYPRHNHVVHTGGKDSQLILLAEKLTDDWHAFSAEPNYGLVREFVADNDLDVDRVFGHDNENEESVADLRRKLVCSDLMSDPRHLRWMVRLREVVEELDGPVIFWSGTEGDTLNSHFPAFHESADYFAGHLERAASWQAIRHQTVKNFTGAPMLSPYHSEHVWEELYRHYDPSMVDPGDDFRPAIGERLHGGPVEWPDANPGPAPYEYEYDVDAFDLYLEELAKRAGRIEA